MELKQSRPQRHRILRITAVHIDPTRYQGIEDWNLNLEEWVGVSDYELNLLVIQILQSTARSAPDQLEVEPNLPRSPVPIRDE